MKIDVEKFKINDYLQHEFDCACGKTHTSSLEHVYINENAKEDILTYIKKHAYKKLYMIEDETTYEVYGKALEDYLNENDILCDHVILQAGVIPDEMAVFQMLSNMKQDYDYILAIGSGTLNDLAKFISHKVGKEYAIIATAPSMDGFASVGAALIIKDLKTTFDAHVPTAIFGDIDILANAPIDMIKAGLGDIVGKYNCLIDWKIAHIVNGEYYCQTIVDMVYKSIKDVVEHADGVLTRDKEAVKIITEALIETGMAMGFVGNSRPASGSEHHVSHYWEMKFLFAHKQPVFHGTKVGLATPGILALWHKVIKEDIAFVKCKEQIKKFDVVKWRERVEACFEGASQGVLALEERAGKNNIEEAMKRIDMIASHWDEIKEIIQTQLPQPQSVVDVLKAVEAPYKPAQVGIDDTLVKQSILLAKEVRVRYGLLQLLWDLGYLDTYCDVFVDYYKTI